LHTGHAGELKVLGVTDFVVVTFWEMHDTKGDESAAELSKRQAQYLLPIMVAAAIAAAVTADSHTGFSLSL
jgi:uncharacterized membrane protein YwzB